MTNEQISAAQQRMRRPRGARTLYKFYMHPKITLPYEPDAKTPDRFCMRPWITLPYEPYMRPQTWIHERNGVRVDGWTGQTLGDDIVSSPHFAPSCRNMFVAANRLTERTARKQAARDRDEFQANCNTCRWWHRKKHEPHKDLALEGRCSRYGGGTTTIWPEDFMGRPCYEARPWTP